MNTFLWVLAIFCALGGGFVLGLFVFANGLVRFFQNAGKYGK